MLIDTPQVVEGSVVINLTVPNGPSLPSTPNSGELFYLTSGTPGLYSYTGTAWEVAARAVDLTNHIADATKHLTTAQNTLLDGITATAAEINSISSIDTRLDTVETDLAAHVTSTTVHLTAAQNTFLDGLTLPSLTAAHVNFLIGTTSNIQTQLNNIVAVNTQQTADINSLQTSTGSDISALQAELDAHEASTTLHLTSAQNTLLDGIAATVTAAEINFLDGVTSPLQTQLSNLSTGKLSVDGSNAMGAALNVGGFRIINVATPVAPSDAATKDYVDNFVQGLHWVGSTKVATTANITLSGLQTIDGVALATSDRVLVKDQLTPANNGIWLAAAGAWSRAADYNTALEINTSAVFVLNGTTQGRSTWVQLNTVTTVGTDPISFSAFSGPVINSAGPGISLGAGGMVSVVEASGIRFDGNAVAVDVHASGGLMTTTDNAASSTASNAQLALTNVGTAGTYRSVTTDAKGRVTAGTNPTTISGYGITDAVNKTGDTMSGNLTVPRLNIVNTDSYLAAFSSTSNSDVAGLLTGSNFGTLLRVAPNGSMVIALDSNDDNDSFAVVAASTTTSTPGKVMDLMPFRVTRRGNATFAGTVTGTSFIGDMTGAASDNVLKAGDTMTGALRLDYANPTLRLDTAASGQSCNIYLETNGLIRWRFGKNTTAEAGANAGSNFFLSAYDDAGVLLSSPLVITRSTGIATFSAAVYAPTFDGDLVGNVTGNVTGNASSATALATTRTIGLSGVTATATGFNGTANITIPITAVPATLLTGTIDDARLPTTISSNITGSAATLTTARTIDLSGVTATAQSFNGSANITIPITAVPTSLLTGTIDADTLGGLALNTSGTNNVANQVVRTNASGYAYFGWINTVSGDNGTTTPTRIYASSDGFIRYYTPANFKTVMDIPDTTVTNVWTGAQRFQSNQNTSTGTTAPLQAYSTGGAGAIMAFYRSGSYAVNLGLDSDNVFRLGGWSAPDNLLQIDMSGNLTMLGNVSAYSDERLKKDIKVIRSAGRKLKEIRGVTFTRIDTNERETGVIAQDVRQVLPEAVTEDANGMLAVKYGNLVGLLIETIKELQADIYDLKKEVRALKSGR